MTTRHTEKLEGLLYAQAMNLAEQHLQKARETSAQIDRELQDKLQRLEETEAARYQAEADQLYKQRLQTARLRIDSELDRLRWTLIEGVLADVRLRLEKLAENREAYRQVLQRYLAEAAQAIPAGRLVAELMPHDAEALRPYWERMVAEAAPGREVALGSLAGHASGGMVVRSEDGSLRVDNTFEGRLARMHEDVLGLIQDRLFPMPEQPS